MTYPYPPLASALLATVLRAYQLTNILYIRGLGAVSKREKGAASNPGSRHRQNTRNSGRTVRKPTRFHSAESGSRFRVQIAKYVYSAQIRCDEITTKRKGPRSRENGWMSTRVSPENVEFFRSVRKPRRELICA